MDETAVKATQMALRQAADHLLDAHVDLGVSREIIGLVDVLHHPTNPLPDFNYVTPRRNTAWVSAQFIRQGMTHLQAYDRAPRVEYMEGLFPPLFARTLDDLGLTLEAKTPIMAYRVESGVALPALPVMPEGTRVETAITRRGIDLWRFVWHNAAFDVRSLGVEPLVLSQELLAQSAEKQTDVVVYRYNFPVAIIRLSVQPDNRSLHVVAAALLREAYTPEMVTLMIASVVHAAVERGCDLVFAPGEGEEDRRVLRDVGFFEAGSMVCYAAPHQDQNQNEKGEHDRMVQPVLSLR